MCVGQDGWYYTGDIGLLNTDLGVDARGRGHLVIIDRKRGLCELYVGHDSTCQGQAHSSTPRHGWTAVSLGLT